MSDKIDKFIAAYAGKKSVYEKYAAYVEQVINDVAGAGLIHTCQKRAKELDSLYKKCRKINKDGDLLYSNPENEITDLAAVRVIVFTREDIDKVCREIRSEFVIIEEEELEIVFLARVASAIKVNIC